MATAAPERIRITEVVGSSICVSIEDGNRLHDVIVEAFQKNIPVALSFEGVGRLTTAFLNAAIGQLYNEYAEEDVRARLLPPAGASPEQLSLLKSVVDNAKRFFADRDRISQIVAEARKDG